MKTYLYPWRWAFKNLYLAYRAMHKGKRDTLSIAAFEFNHETELICLQVELRNKTDCSGLDQSFYIHNPERRQVNIAPSLLPPEGQELGQGHSNAAARGQATASEAAVLRYEWELAGRGTLSK